MQSRGCIRTLCRVALCAALFVQNFPLTLAAGPDGMHGKRQTLMMAALAVVLTLTFLLAVRLLQERKIRRATDESYRRAARLLHMQEQHYRNVLARQKQLRIYRHDMVNHLMAIGNLLELEKYERLKQYLQEIKDPAAEGGSLVSTGNLMLDALLSEKRAQAGEENVWLEDRILLNLHQNLPFAFLDLFLEIGLSHAIQTAGRLTGKKENRWVDLELTQKQGGVVGRLRYACQELDTIEAAKQGLRPMLREIEKRGGVWSLTREEQAISLEISLPTMGSKEKRRPFQWGTSGNRWEMDGQIGDDVYGEGDTL